MKKRERTELEKWADLPQSVQDALGRMTVKHMRFLLSFVFRQRFGHVNNAPQRLSDHEARCWVMGWDDCMHRVWELAEDFGECKRAVPEDD